MLEPSSVFYNDAHDDLGVPGWVDVFDLGGDRFFRAVHKLALVYIGVAAESARTR